MKKANPRSECSTLEHLSFTLTRINRDASGKQTVNRTYWSNRKKFNAPDKNIGHLMRKESGMAAKSTHRNASKEDKAGEKFTQMSLFTLLKQ